MENIAQPETKKDEGKVSVSFRCSKDVKRALKMRAAQLDKSLEEVCVEAVLRGLQHSAAA